MRTGLGNGSGDDLGWNPASNSEGGKGFFFAGEVQTRGGPLG